MAAIYYPQLRNSGTGTTPDYGRPGLNTPHWNKDINKMKRSTSYNKSNYKRRSKTRTTAPYNTTRIKESSRKEVL